MSSQFSPNEVFDRVFLLKGIDERRTKTGKPYLAVVLGTSDGVWDGRVWDMRMSSLPGLTEGDPVKVKGTAQLYQDKIQLIVEEISKVHGQVDPRAIYPSCPFPEEELRSEFLGFVDGIAEPSLKALVEAMLADRDISDGFFTCPAAIAMHHARIGGLAEHSLNVCRLALASLSAAPWLNRDLLTAGALLHDIGKVLEYEVAGDFRHTLEGKFLGHIIQGHSLVERWISTIPDFPERLALDLLHILLSHHGQLEYGSPKTPATAEALVIHFADDLDAKLDMVKEAGEEPGTEEAFVRGLRRSFLFRNEHQDAGRRTQDTEKLEKREAPEGEEKGEGRRAEGEEELEEGKRGSAFAEATADRKGEKGEKKGRERPEKEKKGRGEEGRKEGEGRRAKGEGKKSGQEELF